jgi:hypothetical protein
LGGGNAPQGEMEVVLVLLFETAPTPAPALVLDVALVPDVALDPKPLVFGPVGTLQKVATISSIHIRPVFGRIELFIWAGPKRLLLLRCDRRDRQKQCDGQRKYFHNGLLRWYDTRSADPQS